MGLGLTELEKRINAWKPEKISISVCAIESAQYQFSPDELKQVSGWHPQRIREFAAGREAAYKALAKLGVSPAPLLRGEDRTPQWPEGITGSITHSGDNALAAVASCSDYLGIGIDLEQMSKFPEKVFRRISLPEEKEWIYSLGPESIQWTAPFLFSAKESFYKAQYPLTQARLGFHDVMIQLGDKAGWFTAQYNKKHPARRYPDNPCFIGRYILLEDYIFTLSLLKARNS